MASASAMAATKSAAAPVESTSPKSAIPMESATTKPAAAMESSAGTRETTSMKSTAEGTSPAETTDTPAK